MQRTHTRTDDAARVSRKVQGDLESLVRLYSLTSTTSAEDLAHDLRIGLESGCIERAQVFVHDALGALKQVIKYGVTAADGVEGSLNSGRFDFDERLKGGTYRIEIDLLDRPKWEGLKSSGALRIRWTPCDSTSTAGMSSTPSGAYVSGDLALQRSILRSM